MNIKTLKPFSLGFQYPTGDEVKKLIVKSNYTGAQIADLLGVNSRQVREWQGGSKRISYSEWRLLCALVGLVKINPLPPGPKQLVFLFIDQGKLKVTFDDKTIKPSAQILGQSTINLPFNTIEKQKYLNDILEQVAQSDEPLTAFSILANEKFEQSGGLTNLFKEKTT